MKGEVGLEAPPGVQGGNRRGPGTSGAQRDQKEPRE